MTNPKIANDAVGAVKIRNGAVTNPKIANNAIDSQQIRDGAITRAKFADNTLTGTQIDVPTLPLVGQAERFYAPAPVTIPNRVPLSNPPA